MENPAAEVNNVNEDTLWTPEGDTSDLVKRETDEEPSPRGPFAEVGTSLDKLLTRPESQGWLIASLVLALFLYLVAWFLNDAWYFAASKWAEVSGQGATATMTVSPTLSFSSTVPISPVSLVLTSSSPPALFCGGMACGAAIVLAIVLIICGLVKE
jgi:hypothetical protein